jgi:lipopolysaccharide transport system ATP-binding protein
MSSERTVICARGLGKCYQIYRDPKDRLKQKILPKLQKLVHRPLSQYFREFWALKNVSLEVRRGETVGIIGRNGSGKSTLLQIICGTLEPTEGSIETRGRIAALLELGAGFNPEFTGRENVFLNATVLGLKSSEIQRKFPDIEAFADIGEFIDQPVKHYSSGMFARLAFAVAISVDPEILIVDEALAVGDEPFQRKCFARIEEIKRNGGSILLVSHSAANIVALCDRAVLLDRGERLFTGAAKIAVNWYKKIFNAPAESVESIRAELRRLDQNGRPESENLGTSLQVGSPSHSIEAAEVQSAAENMGSDYDPNLRSKSRLVYETNGAIIQNPRIETLEGEQVNELVRGKRYKICYEVLIEQPHPSLYFRCMVKTVSGIELGGGHYPSLKAAGYSAKAGELVSLSFEFDCQINVGTYFINCGVSDNTVTLHRILDALAFRVMNPEDSSAIGIIDFDIVSDLRTLPAGSPEFRAGATES